VIRFGRTLFSRLSTPCSGGRAGRPRAVTRGGTWIRDHREPEVDPRGSALLDLLLEVLVGRGDHAHVHLDGPRRSEPLDFAFLQHRAGLGLGAHVADFVEGRWCAIGLLELADLFSVAP
jgi:hypothetical protein